MTASTAPEIAQSYHRAWTRGDVDSAMSFVADDIDCQAPGADRVAEYLTVRAGKFAESVLTFDRLSSGPPRGARGGAER